MILAKKVADKFGNEQRQQDVLLVLTQLIPLVKDTFNAQIEAILTPSFDAASDVKKAEKLLTGFNLMDKTGISFKTVAAALNLTAADMPIS